MTARRKSSTKKRQHELAIIGITFIILCAVLLVMNVGRLFPQTYERVSDASIKKPAMQQVAQPKIESLNIAEYDRRMNALAHIKIATTTSLVATSTASSTATTTIKKAPLWPVKTVYPNAGAILPFKRIIAYYGNFYSKGMGVLGQYPAPEMLSRLQTELDKWQAADPTTPVIPAIDYIAVGAQAGPGRDGMYRLRMPDDQIDHALDLAHQVNGIVILDIQVGLSTLQSELPELEKYLKMPEVHLAIDPEFSMKDGAKPGTEIGTFDAADVNYAANYLAKLVKENNLPPKVLIVHRFTRPMVTNYKQIKPLPEVQIVMDMDGWGPPANKIGTYNAFIAPEPVQFTGFKLFYKNDRRVASSSLLTPQQVLKLTPAPVFIQYQ